MVNTALDLVNGLQLCRNAGFKNVKVSPVKGFEWFKVLAATK